MALSQMENNNKTPDHQWQGAQGCKWWELDIVKNKFTSDESKLCVQINDNFVVHGLTKKKWVSFELRINDYYYKTSCEHIDEDLYWLFDNLKELIFMLDIKKNVIKSMPLKRFEKKGDKILSKPGYRIFSISGKIEKQDTP